MGYYSKTETAVRGRWGHTLEIVLWVSSVTFLSKEVKEGCCGVGCVILPLGQDFFLGCEFKGQVLERVLSKTREVAELLLCGILYLNLVVWPSLYAMIFFSFSFFFSFPIVLCSNLKILISIRKCYTVKEFWKQDTFFQHGTIKRYLFQK